MRLQSYFNTAVILITKYEGTMPLVHYLKQYFAQHKKHGSKDRKHISHLCYCYYRLGHAAEILPLEQRLYLALFLCQDTPGEWVTLFENGWIENWTPDLPGRVDFVQTIFPSLNIANIFPWVNELSEEIDAHHFALSHLIQPDLFLRIRPGYEQQVAKKLTHANIPFTSITPSCLALPNGSKTDTVLNMDKEVVIQDYSSQHISNLLSIINSPQSAILQVWDCCAASGGKSILAKDILENIDLTVTDIRPSILQNLQQRFERAGIGNYHAFVTDLVKPNFKFQAADFRLIICDAPCTGSGTWGRTPEQLCHFSKDRVSDYAILQKKIVGNVIPYLATDGYLLYITCSVFKKENEEVADFIQQDPSLELVKMELLKGYDIKADSMFAALFRKKDG
ncbi:MAG: hypothetical protein NVSMB63_12870 [Sediminibacterium sp.]